MFETVIAADVGSSVTRLASRRTITENETRAALDPKNSSRVLAVGAEARKFLGATEAYPVRGGISDITLTALMLRRFALELIGRRSLIGVSLRLAFPFAEKPIDLAAAVEAGREAGFRSVTPVSAMLAAAEGAGVDISSDTARMIVDIGCEGMNTLVCANGGAIAETHSPMGSRLVTKRIMAFFANEQHLLISAATAEKLKKALGSPLLRVSGRDPSSGMNSVRELRPSVLRAAVEPAVEMLSGEIAASIMRLPAEAAADLYDNGVVLVGGGALQYGLAESFEAKLGIPVSTAPNAENAVILGMQTMLRRGSVAEPAALAGSGAAQR